MRRHALLPLAFSWLAAGAVLAAPAPMAPPAKLGQCVACHGRNGQGSVPGIPRLAGQDETYLVAALTAYRQGGRQSPIMNSIANTLQPRDIAALARWYSRQPPAVSR